MNSNKTNSSITVRPLVANGKELTALLAKNPEASGQDVLVAAFTDAGLLKGLVSNYMSWNNDRPQLGMLDYSQVERLLNSSGLSAYLPLFNDAKNAGSISFKDFSERLTTKAREIVKREKCDCADMVALTESKMILAA